jgi:hypothetical protein
VKTSSAADNLAICISIFSLKLSCSFMAKENISILAFIFSRISSLTAIFFDKSSLILPWSIINSLKGGNLVFGEL